MAHFSKHLANTLTMAASQKTRLTLGDLWHQLLGTDRGQGFGLVLMITALPSALPVPAPGYSTPFGVLILLLCGQWLLGKDLPWLPQWAQRIPLPPSLLNKMLPFLARIFGMLEKWIRPRAPWVFSWLGSTFFILVIAAMAILMIIPIPGTNTLPAMIILACGIALTERDGILALLTLLAGIVATLAYGLLLFVIFYFGASGLSEAWTKVMTLFTT